MNRTARITLSVATVSAAAALPLGAYAVGGGSGSASCSTQQRAVTTAQAIVGHDQAVLSTASRKKAKNHKAKATKQRAIAKATRRLAHDEARLNAVQAALIACQKALPAPTVTVTAAGKPSTSTPPALSWRSGTALLKETMPDGSPIAPLSTWDGVPLAGTGFGSAWTADPAHPGYFYGLTDRGPNVAYADGSSLHKLEPLPGFQDTIGYFHQVGGSMQLVRKIGLTTSDGEPYGGLESTVASAGETIYDMYGDKLPASKAGLDTEGIVVMPDGSFWISDEYGPLITHFDAAGKQIEQLSPYADGSDPDVHPLPAELELRNANKGMEGLTLTPDHQYLVGVMQSSLNNDSSSATGMITRVVKIKLSDLSVQEYLYSLHDAVNPNGGKAYEGQANSEITAVDDSHFLVDERDGKFEGRTGGKQKADKNLFEIDLAGATDVGPTSPLIGTTIAGGAVTWDDAKGLLVGGQTIEKLVGTRSGLASPADSGWQNTAVTTAAPTAPPAPQGAVDALAAAGITPVGESLYLNYAGLVSSIDPSGMYFGHDKVEGVALGPGGKLYISNDSDFGITDMPLASAGGYLPTADHRAKGTDVEKFLPDGKTQDFGEILEVDLGKVPAQFK